MISFVVRRMFGLVATVWIVYTATFFLMYAVPGGPFSSERKLDPEVEANLKRAYNLDLPVHEQYFIRLGRVLRGDLGPSFRLADFTVAEIIAQGLPISAALGASLSSTRSRTDLRNISCSSVNEKFSPSLMAAMVLPRWGLRPSRSARGPLRERVCRGPTSVR